MTFDVDREQFRSIAETDQPAVVRVEADLDLDIDPLAAYAALTGRTTDAANAPYSFLLESAEKVASSDPDGAFAPTTEDRHARFSFVGYDPKAVVTVGAEETELDILDDRYRDLLETNGGDTIDSLRAVLPDVTRKNFPERDRQQLDGGLVGFLAYDAVYDLWLEEVGIERPESRYPDAQFVLTTRTLVFDHAEETLSVVCTPVIRERDDAGAIYDDLTAEVDRISDLLENADPLETGGFSLEREVAGPKDEYEDAVEQTKEHVYSGDIYQGVISRTRELYGEVDTLGLYESLREINPSPYMYLLSHDDKSIVGASPETLVSVGDRRIVSNPIAGTCSRGNSPVEDRRLAGEMLADGKERAEHTMLVDLARNDVRRVAEPGSVRVEEFMNVLKYSHVQHIESTVTGTLDREYDAFDAVRASFPAGTLSGAPKIRAMEIIDDLERTPRGPYGGGVGYVSWSDDADFAIVIRTATVEQTETDQRITVQAGAGIVADSDPTAEYEETEKKMDGVLDALDRIEDTGTDREAETTEVEQ
ncbi:anthranilate synthase component I [Halobacteriaceae archaeon SHR40]|uniref:anthranilate synthase component I n=1 Tax=Halovenus amylolytica TaxID=2500550 RepID=UPI000FE3FD9D